MPSRTSANDQGTPAGETAKSTTPVSDRLPPGQQLVAANKWPLVGERGPADRTDPWTVRVCGAVDTERTWTLETLAEMPQVARQVDIHCVTRWSKLDVTFAGVRLADLLDNCKPRSEAAFVSFVARSDRKHSSSLPLAEAVSLDALVATEVDGQPLPAQHGGPVRLVVPGKYFYKSVKWLETIEILPEDRLGFWEAESGYHNGADPWREQRYIAGSIDRRLAADLIASRSFAGRDLLSLDCSDRDLEQLDASSALLRNASFARSNVSRATFRGANLSNACFRGANLWHTDLSMADLEGADFAGADLRGADLSGSSLFGASFADVDPDTNELRETARLDASTTIDVEALERLTETQLAFVTRCLRG